MLLKSVSKSILLVLSVSCIANAYLVPGSPAPLPGYQEPLPGSTQDTCYDSNGYLIPCHGGGGGSFPNPGGDTNPYDPNPYDPNPYDPNPGYPTYPTDPGYPSYGNQETKTIYIGRSVRNERLPLRQLAGIGSQYRGWEVISVRANTRPNSSARTTVQLVSDGRIIAQQINPGYQINLMPTRAMLTSNSSLQLVVSGSTIIDQIEIELVNTQGGGGVPHEPPPYPGNPGYPDQPGYGSQNIELNIYRNVYGNDRIDLTQYMNLSSYRGRAIEQIIVTGTASYGSATMSVVINGNNMGMVSFSGGYSQRESVWLSQRPVIGMGADSIVLYSSGNMTVEHVTLVLSY